MLTISNVEIWSPEGIKRNQNVSIDDQGRLLPSTPTTTHDHIDGSKWALLPAGVDAQVHLRVPGQAHKETPLTGLTAALRGGYAAVLTMPNTQPTIDSLEVLKKGQHDVREAEQQTGVQVFWSAAITRRLNSQDLTPFQELVQGGVKAFTNDGLGVESDAVMDQAFAKLEQFDIPLLQHAEFLGHGGSLAPGPVQRRLGAKPYPDDAEWRMVERDLRELRKHPKARYHVLHVSSRKTVELVRQGKKDGLNVTAETSPHHLYFNTETIGEDLSFKMNPPIRAREDQDALWEALKDGTLDFVATDHAPHEKTMKSGRMDEAAFGTLGLESALRVLLYGWKHRGLTPQRLVQVWADRPARFLRLPKEFGAFTPNERFHGILVDTQAPELVHAESEVSSLSKNSCFVGTKLPGRIVGALHGTQMNWF